MSNRLAVHLIAFTYPLIVLTGAWLNGLWTWAAFLLGATLYPAIEFLEGNRVSISQNIVSENQYSKGHWILIIFAVVELITLGIVLTAIASNRYEIWELIGLTLSLGAMTGGVGIPVAHELIHRRERTFQRMGLLLLAAVNYMHFKIEHLRGHHVRVATEEDPATARRGESVWAFVPRSSIGQFKSAWALENKRLYANADTANMNWLKNAVFHYCTIQCLVAIIIFILLGLTAIIIFVAQSIFAITLLEFINYIEHYGLMRTKRSDGRYEAIRAHHSWATNSLLTNIITFNLGHHADHHTQPNRPFDELIDRLDAPHLPAGYLAMIYLACFPRFWRTVIHPRLDAFDVLCQDR